MRIVIGATHCTPEFAREVLGKFHIIDVDIVAVCHPDTVARHLVISFHNEEDATIFEMKQIEKYLKLPNDGSRFDPHLPIVQTLGIDDG